MTLNSSGPISLGGTGTNASINLELSQAFNAQISMNDTNVRALAGVPSGAIVMPTNFYGKSATTVNFFDASVFASSGGPASAGYRVGSDGFAYEFINGTSTALYQWVTPTSVVGDYEIYATLSSGTLNTGTVGSWIPASDNEIWVKTQSITGTGITELVMDVRKIGTATILDTWSVQLEAERF